VTVDNQDQRIKQNVEETMQFLDENFTESVEKLRESMASVMARLREEPDAEPYEELTIAGRQIMLIYDQEAEQWSAMDADELRRLYTESMTGRIWGAP
jgi:hypothetical protein